MKDLVIWMRINAQKTEQIPHDWPFQSLLVLIYTILQTEPIYNLGGFKQSSLGQVGILAIIRLHCI